jgi:hypothetical protein
MVEFPRLLSLVPREKDDLPLFSYHNVSVYQVFQHYPSLQPLYPFQWERHADLTEFMKWAEQRPSFAWIVMSVYVVIVLLYNFWRDTKKWSPTKLKKS